MRHTFDNGYGLSVIDSRDNPFAYGDGGENPYEVAITHDGSMCYSTPITSDVLGYRNADEVADLKRKVAALPQNERCLHGRPA